MTLTLELPVEIETELREVAAARGVAVEAVAVERLRGPNSRRTRSNALSALDDLLALGARLTSGTEPLSDDAAARSYEDYDHAKVAA